MSAANCTPHAAETTRSAPTFGCGSAKRWTALITSWKRCNERSWAAAMPTSTSSCRPTRICSGHSQSWHRTIGSPTSKNSIAIASRIADCRRRVNQCSLGVAAVAGTTLADRSRDKPPSCCDFDGVTANSLDTSSDRDFMLETAFVLSVIASHLSGWAEEWILWSTVEFNFIKIPQAFCTGSSIMPQKVNPDTLELTRGKSARVMGNLQTLMLLVKNLPMAYNRDLQEDKPPLFDSFDTVMAMLELGRPDRRRAASCSASRLPAGWNEATWTQRH